MSSNTEIFGLSLGYIFTFDFGSENIINFSEVTTEKLLDDFSACYYIFGKDKEVTRTDESDLLKSYKKGMYDLRFKKNILSKRKSILIQLPSSQITGLSRNNNEVSASKIKMDVSIILTEMGVGSLVLWLDIFDKSAFKFNQLFNLHDTANLKTNIDLALGNKNIIRINGINSLDDIARFIIISLNCYFFDNISQQKNNKKKRKTLSQEVRELINENQSMESIHEYLCKKTSTENIIVSNQIESYPIYHIDFKEITNGNNEKVNSFIQNNKAEIRALLTKDKNWDKKKSEIVDKFISEHNYTTRDSIHWFTSNNGSLKIYSNQLETPLLTSKVLITFEIELVLTMKHYIYKIIRNLDYFTVLSNNSLPLRSVARFRNNEMRRLDEYYNLDFLQKDTTKIRIDKFKKMFNINDVLQIAIMKIESLNLYLNTEYQNASEIRQVIISIVFGVFGAGTLINDILIFLIERQEIKFPFIYHSLSIVSTMFFVGLLIYKFSNRVKMK